MIRNTIGGGRFPHVLMVARTSRSVRQVRARRTVRRRNAGFDSLRSVEFLKELNAYLIRDQRANFRAVLHTQRPVPIAAASVVEAAETYLRDYASLLGLETAHLRNLRSPLGQGSSPGAVEYRLLCETRHSDVTTVAFQQAAVGLAVCQAELSVHLRHVGRGFEVIAAQTTRESAFVPCAF